MACGGWAILRCRRTLTVMNALGRGRRRGGRRGRRVVCRETETGDAIAFQRQSWREQQPNFQTAGNQNTGCANFTSARTKDFSFTSQTLTRRAKGWTRGCVWSAYRWCASPSSVQVGVSSSRSSIQSIVVQMVTIGCQRSPPPMCSRCINFCPLVRC